LPIFYASACLRFLSRCPFANLSSNKTGSALVVGARGACFLHISVAVFGTLPLSRSELARRTWREALDDDILGLAAQLSYYLFLALFPAILFLLALASFFPLSNITDDVARSTGPFVSPQVLELIQDQMRRLAGGDSGGLLT